MMGTVCGDPAAAHHKFHHSHHLYLGKKSLREMDIPPRKLLGRSRSSPAGEVFAAAGAASPRVEDALFSKFLPSNKVDDDDSDPYSSDYFRMYEFKVRKCSRSRSHDWMDCPFAHPGEKARRRDPRRFQYSGTVCSEFRKGYCGEGDNCEFSHGVFECWLHPTRYRTEACKDGKNCKRKVCFFAHSSRQLRILPDPASPTAVSPPGSEKVYRNLNNCCAFCHASPTSTLNMGTSHFSPPLSPPLSPPMHTPEFSRLSGMESCGFPELNAGGVGGGAYKDSLTDLMASFEAMNVNEAPLSHSAAAANAAVNLPWLDVNCFSVDDQPQFASSPSTLSPGSSQFIVGDGKYFGGRFPGRNLAAEMNRYPNENNQLPAPDLGWVNDLLT